MPLKIIKASAYNPGDQRSISSEVRLSSLRFTVHKFTPRRKPVRTEDTVIFSLFSEFGSETLAPIYCVPRMLKTYAGKYTIVMGWYGRAFLYKHLVDEFWELGEEYQYLREYCRAFHNESANLKRLEEKAKQFGKVIPSAEMGNVAVYPRLEECPVMVNKYQCKGQMIDDGEGQICVKCSTRFPSPGLFHDVNEAKKEALWLPSPTAAKGRRASELLKPNSIGITARNRQCYSRNLPPDFYERLIYMLEDMGYNPVWLGEKATTLSCPCDRILDFSRMPESRDLEMTLALVSKLKFTVQFWTASTRLAGFVGTPFLLFESPDQIWGGAQEGYRLNLCSRGPKKIVAAHFKNVLKDQESALKIVQHAIFQMEQGDYRTLVGQVDDVKGVTDMILANSSRVGF